MARKKGRDAVESKTARTVRLNIRLDAETHRKLHLHSLMASKTPGEVVTELVNAHCREWTVRRLADRSESGDGNNGAEGAATPLRGL